MRDTGEEPAWSRWYLLRVLLHIGVKPLPCKASDSKVRKDRKVMWFTVKIAVRSRRITTDDGLADLAAWSLSVVRTLTVECTCISCLSPARSE